LIVWYQEGGVNGTSFGEGGRSKKAEIKNACQRECVSSLLTVKTESTRPQNALQKKCQEKPAAAEIPFVGPSRKRRERECTFSPSSDLWPTKKERYIDKKVIQKPLPIRGWDTDRDEFLLERQEENDQRAKRR